KKKKKNKIKLSQKKKQKKLSNYKANLNVIPTEYIYLKRGNYHKLANNSGNKNFIHWNNNFKDHKGK
ncbi:MAG: hypothetical protein Q3X38_19065, partial [Citrobacter sp.]|nr:hypothetical protein [Citrobacter sp.]